MSTDRMPVSSPVSDGINYCFHTMVRTGRVPIPTVCNGDDFAKTFQFNFDWGKTVGRWREAASHSGNRRGFNRSDFKNWNELFLRHIGDIFAEHGFSGTLYATGMASRGNKKAWEFRLTGCNFKPDQNFVLAKLMGKELFEEETWKRVSQEYFVIA